MMLYAAHKELFETASWSTSFPAHDSWGISLKRKIVEGCSRVIGDRVSKFQALFLPICASLSEEFGAALVGVWYRAHGFEYLVSGTVICRAASKGFWRPVHPVHTANLVLGSSLGSREFDLRASGKRAAWPCHVLNVSAEEKYPTFQLQDKVI
jgi:hypothetical protein